MVDNAPTVPNKSSVLHKGKLSPSKRARIWELHKSNLKLSQTQLAETVKREFNLSKLTQSSISSVLKEFNAAAAKSGNLTMAQCQKIVQKSIENPKMTQKMLSEWAKQEFNMVKALSQPAISNIVNKKRQVPDDISESELNLKKPRAVKCGNLDDILASWVIDCQERRIALSWQILQKKALFFADELSIPEEDRPAFSNGWVEKFLLRHNLKSMKLSGERGSADIDAIRAELPSLQRIISRYKASDVFNMDETGLFYCMAPDRTIASRQLGGMKKDKKRMTVALCANSDGTEKRALFFIGHSEKPRCFKKKRAKELGYYYRWNKKAWMTSLLFQQWVEDFDQDMRKQQRQVLMLLDNAPTHAVKSLELTNVTVMFLPPNTTSLIQPMDAGIIAAFKKRYRSFQLGLALDREKSQAQDIYKVDILQAMSWCRDAWTMITPASIKNCWYHTGLLDAVAVDEELVEHALIDEFDEILSENIKGLSQHPMEFYEYLSQDNEFEVHQQLEDNGLLATYRETSDTDDDGVEKYEEIKEIGLEDKIRALRIGIEILSENTFANFHEIKKLRRLLYGFCRDQSEQARASLKQIDIRTYFT